MVSVHRPLMRCVSSMNAYMALHGQDNARTHLSSARPISFITRPGTTSASKPLDISEYEWFALKRRSHLPIGVGPRVLPEFNQYVSVVGDCHLTRASCSPMSASRAEGPFVLLLDLCADEKRHAPLDLSPSKERIGTREVSCALPRPAQASSPWFIKFCITTGTYYWQGT
ncbi:hypothetical protein EI94DRAFT_642729 [Lactarius quietus]|nr:hypothetical protein EI94DRAFT_642729 [Lactarius quietus]